MSGYDEIQCEMPLPAADPRRGTVFHARAFIAVFGEKGGFVARHSLPAAMKYLPSGVVG